MAAMRKAVNKKHGDVKSFGFSHPFSVEYGIRKAVSSVNAYFLMMLEIYIYLCGNM